MKECTTEACLENSEMLFNEEIAFLVKSSSNQNFSTPHVFGNLQTKSAEKIFVGNQLRQAFWSKHGAELTQTSRADGRSILNHAGMKFSYGYQRYDLNSTPQLFSLAYGEDKLQNDFVSNGFFCASGMASIASFFEAVESAGIRSVEIPADAYFETMLISEHLMEKTRTSRPIGKNFRWIYLDSISKDNPLSLLPFDSSRTENLCVAADTTCWRLSSPQMQELLGWAVKFSVPVILLRSHTKLDFMGLDNGRLGSMIAICPCGINAGRMEHIKTICEEAKRRTVRTGRNFRVEDIPLFWGTNQATALSDRRLKRIQSTAQLIWQAISQAAPHLKVFLPSHQLFLLIWSSGPCKEYALSIADNLRKKNFDAAQTSGFGFDFLAVDAYVDSTDNVEVVRLSPGVYSVESPADAMRIVSCL